MVYPAVYKMAEVTALVWIPDIVRIAIKYELKAQPAIAIQTNMDCEQVTNDEKPSESIGASHY